MIGGTGFIGRHVVSKLADAGHPVTVFQRGRTETDLPPHVQRLHGDLGELSLHTEALDRCAPDVVLHMLAMTEREAEEAVRTLMGRTSRLVAISSADVYRARNRLFRVEPGPPDPVPLAEDAPLRSVLYPYRATAPGPSHRLYHYDKIPVEQVVMAAAALRGTILRLPFVYGPGDRQHRLFEYLRRMDQGRPAIPLRQDYAGWRCTRGYVENVAAAIARAVTDDSAAVRIYNVGEEVAFTEAEWVRKIGEIAGWGGEVVPVPEDSLPGAPSLATEQHLVLNTSRIRHELGHLDPVPVEAGLERTVAWERSHPPDPLPPPPDFAAEDRAIVRAR